MNDDDRSRRLRMGKALFGLMALASVLIGLAIYFFADALGLERDVAVLLAIGFLVAGVVDYVLLANWEKLNRSRPK